MLNFIVSLEEEGLRLDQFLHARSGFSRSKIIKLIAEGKIININSKISPNISTNININIPELKTLKPAYKVKTAEHYQFLDTVTEGYEQKPYYFNLDIIYEDDYLIIINKPAGLVVHPGVGNHDNTLVNALVAHLGEERLSNKASIRPGLVHRLDKDTSGLIIIAKDDHTHEILCRAIKERKIIRKYLAIVHGKPPMAGKLETFIKPNRKNREIMEVHTTCGKSAITNYKLLEYFKQQNISKIECQLSTGRTHQIRVHMQYLGHPILGDKTYGKNSALDLQLEGQALHAYKLSFAHPINGKLLDFMLEMPFSMRAIIT